LEQFFPFFIVLFAGVFFSGIFKSFHLPWAVALLVGGIIIGPHGLKFFEVDNTINFIGQIGLVFLMFMAGLESRLSEFDGSKKDLFFLTVINGLIPFIVGFIISSLFGFGNTTSILIGIVFVSSSVAVVIPSLESTGLIYSNLGKSIIASTVLQDIVSLILLSVFLQNINPITVLPLPLLYTLLFVAVMFLRWLIPKARWIFSVTTDEQDRVFFQRELRSIFTILIGTVIIFEILGLHPIVAGFFAGLVLSDSIKSGVLLDKIRTISYGLFIPTFFVVVGAQADISVFSGSSAIFILAISLLLGSVLSKYLSGYFGAKAVGFSNTEAKLFGASSIPQLSTTLAVAFTGFELGLFGQGILTSMIILSVFTTFIGPILMGWFSKS
jgi:Kef-type K+ transport system membrane component KefB